MSADLASNLQVIPAEPPFSGARPAVLVLPGGGYRYHAPHEGEGVARWWSSVGCHAAVLHYPLPSESPWPSPLAAAREALQWWRTGDHGLAVDARAVGVFGASSGGHLAGLLATGAILGSLEQAPSSPPRPDFAVLAYSVADLDLLPDVAVSGMLGGRMELRAELSPVTHLGAETCPLFVWTTMEDPPGLTNALRWAEAAQEVGASLELHVYPEGWHGLGLADGVSWGDPPAGERMPPLASIPHTATWRDACQRWLDDVVLGNEPTGPGGLTAPSSR